MNINSEENIKKLLQAACKPAVASSQFKEQLLKRLIHTIGITSKTSLRPLWRQPRLWAPIITAALILAAIAYGLWLPQTAIPGVTPPPTAVGTGILEIRVTDAPPQYEVTAINVTIANIEVHKAGDVGS